MWEMLHIASGYRLPILMALVNRALSAPLNIHGDHSDGMGMRDCGWIQLFSENAQEAYDNTIMAYRIAEHKDVRLPIAVNMDGFIISHSIESMQYMPDADVKKFVGDYIADRSRCSTSTTLRASARWCCRTTTWSTSGPSTKPC